jgi:hypothetical protein
VALVGALGLAAGPAQLARAASSTTDSTTTAGTTTASTTTASTTTAGTTTAGTTTASTTTASTTTAGTTTGATTPAASALPSGFSDQDINEKSGSASVSGTDASAVWTVTALGGDITGTADQMHYVYASLPGNGGITAHLLSQTGGDKGGWQKSGVMIRETLDKGSMMDAIHYGGIGTSHATGVLETLSRPGPNKSVVSGPTVNYDLTNNGPVWLRAQRNGQDFQLLYSTNGKDWQVVDDRTINIPAGESIFAGLTSSSHGTTTPVTATFDNVSVSSDVIQPSILPGPTQVVAVGGNGAVLLTYNTSTGASYNIYRQPVGSKNPATLVNSSPTANGWFIDTSVTNGTAYLYTITTVTKSLADATKTNEGPASAAVLAQPTAPIDGFNVQYGGNITPATLAVDNNGVLTLTAAGSPIWDQSANGTFLAAPVAGDYSISVKVLSPPTRQTGLKQNSDTKVGPMIRASAGVVPGDDYAWLFTADRTDGNGVILEGRPSGAKSAAYSETATKEANVKYPLWLILSKKGAVITGYQSNDGSTFTQAGTSHDYGLLPALTYAGIAATSGDSTKTMTVTLDANRLPIGAPFTPPAAPATPAVTPPATTGGTSAATPTGGTPAATTTGGTTAATTTAATTTGATTAATTTGGTTASTTTSSTTAATTTSGTTGGTTTAATTTGGTTAGTTTAATTGGTTAGTTTA